MSDDDTRRLWFDAMGQAYRVPSAGPLTIYFRPCRACGSLIDLTPICQECAKKLPNPENEREPSR